MRKNKKMYENYVCPNCFKQLNKCTCKHLPRDLIHIDVDMQECIRVLNKKGYKTIYCCASHLEAYKKHGFSEIYLGFVNWIDIGNEYPNSFKKDKNKYDNFIRYHYAKNLSDEEFTNTKNEQLQLLLNWCNSLPVYTNK